jgi:hypothetical protein
MAAVIKTYGVRYNLIFIDDEHAHINSGYIHHAQYIPQHPFTIIPCSNEQAFEHRQDMINKMKNCSETHSRLQHNLMIIMWENWN